PCALPIFLPPRLPSIVGGPPNLIYPSNHPVMTTLPLPSTAMPAPSSLAPLGKFLDQRCDPSAAAYFATKTSSPPSELVKVAPPKLTVPLKYPVMKTLPLPSTATPYAAFAAPAPPHRLDQRRAPVGVYFATKISAELTLVSGPPPKSTVFEKVPATTILPPASTATASA